jgi:hypothetical protein
MPFDKPFAHSYMGTSSSFNLSLEHNQPMVGWLGGWLYPRPSKVPEFGTNMSYKERNFGDIPVDSELLLMTLSISKPNPPA